MLLTIEKKLKEEAFICLHFFNDRPRTYWTSGFYLPPLKGNLQRNPPQLDAYHNKMIRIQVSRNKSKQKFEDDLRPKPR